MERLRIDNWIDYIDFTSGGIFAGVFGSDFWPWDACNDIPACCYSPHYINPVTERYEAMLKEFTGYESVCLFTTGAEATEAFWRCMRVYTGKPGIWGGLIDPDEVGTEKPLCDAMHGVTLGALIMAGRLQWHELGVFPELGASRFGTVPEMTSGMIMEPYHAPSAQFHRVDPTINRVRELQRTFKDIPLCIDEVQGGFGRTGKLFAHQWYEDFKPDFVCCGKGMGGGLPLSALLGPKEILEDPRVLGHAHLHSTHSGNPLMCAVGIEVIERLERESLISESYRKGLWLSEHLKGCGVRFHAGRGLLAGLEFAGPMQAEKVVRKCRECGLLTVPTGRKWVKLGPPLTISDEQLEQGCAILRAAIEEVLDADSEACGNEGRGFEEGDGVLPEARVQPEVTVERAVGAADAQDCQAPGDGQERNG